MLTWSPASRYWPRNHGLPQSSAPPRCVAPLLDSRRRRCKPQAVPTIQQSPVREQPVPQPSPQQPLPTLPHGPCKLLTPHGQLRAESLAEACSFGSPLQSEKVQVLSDNTAFLVVGVIGGDRVGKTRALSLLSEVRIRRFSGCCELCVQLESFSDSTTEGVDALVTPRRVILLDTQVPSPGRAAS